MHYLDTIVILISFDMQEIAEASNDELQQPKQFTSTSLKLKKFILSETASSIYCDTSKEEIRPYIPESLRRRFWHGASDVSSKRQGNSLTNLCG